MADMLLDATVFRDSLEGDEGALTVLRQIMDESIKASISPVRTPTTPRRRRGS